MVVPALPIPLDKLLDKCINAYSDLLTADMVPLKAIYIQDPQTKIFYQLDDKNNVKKGNELQYPYPLNSETPTRPISKI